MHKSLFRARARSIVLCVVTLGVATLAVAQTPVGSTSDTATASAIVNETPSHWFVELSSPPTADGGDPATLASEHASFRAAARAVGLNYNENYSYQDLFNGFSVSVAPADIGKLKRIPGVQRIYPVSTVNLPASEAVVPDTTATLPASDAVVPDTPDQQSWLKMTGADLAQNELSLYGDGVRAAIIDTGIDYHHPDLGGCFGPGCRVSMGFDLVGDAYNGANTPVPDPDPMDCAGHGTHVTGILGADGHGLTGHVTGVAPHVTFHVYRVFGCTGSSGDDVILAALEMAAADGTDIVSMSLGGAYDDWAESPTAAASDRLVREGIVVVAAAGNSGSAGGTYATGAPSTGQKVISVASYENLTVKLPSFTVSPDNMPFGYNAAAGAPTPPTSGTYTMARTGTTVTPNDACSPLGGNFSGKVVLIRRGTCTFYTKAFNAQQAGAAGVVLYNNVVGLVSPTVVGSPAVTIPVVAITAADGATINSRIAGGATTMTWTNQLIEVPNPSAGLVSTFSSFGPTAELDFKPDLGAPGGNIFSTWPLALGGYATLSGTSMSTPHVSGSVALLLQARPHTPPPLVRTLLQNDAVPANWNGNPRLGFLDNVPVQGAGLIHIDHTVLNSVSVSPGKLALLDSATGPSTQTLTFSNEGTSDVTYDLSQVAALTTGATEFTISEWLAPANVSFSAATVTVPAGGTASISVTITAPATPSLFTYGGYLVATPEGGGLTLRVPYMGVVNYEAETILGLRASGFPRMTRGDLSPLGNGAVFTMTDANNIPYFLYQLAHAARLLQVDIFSSTAGGTLGKSWQRAAQLEFLPRNSSPTGIFEFGFDGTTSSGNKITVLPNGSYVAVMTVLKPLGDPSNPADVETWTSPVFTISRP